jgi:hypothetical protein
MRLILIVDGLTSIRCSRDKGVTGAVPLGSAYRRKTAVSAR